jgi:hypothetical protein
LLDIEARTKGELPSIRYQRVHLVAQRTIEGLAPKIQEKIRSFVSRHSYTKARFDAEVPEVLKLLERGIAPVEFRDKSGEFVPADLTAIINAAWELYRTKMDGFLDLFRSTVSESQRLSTLNHLVFKAIEASEVVRLWKKI